jgi:hypothetical protein
MAYDPNARPPGAPRPPGFASWIDARATGAALALLALLLLQGLLFIGEASQTSDEAAHLAAGYSYLTRGDFRLNPEHPPLIKEIAALPLLALDLDFPDGPLWDIAEEWNIGRQFVHENRVPNDTILFLARLPVLLLAMTLGWAMFAWGRRLFGPRGALIALALYVLDPNVVAHGSLVTTDLGVTLFIFLTVHALWRWSEAPSPRALAIAGAMAGCAMASKYTALWLPPILAPLALLLLLLGEPLPARPWSARSPMLPEGAGLLRRAAALVQALLIPGAVGAAALAASYFFTGLPAFFVGLERGLWHSGSGHMAYLMGSTSETGWWFYFLLAYAIKTPIGTLLVLAAAIAALPAGRRLRLKDEMFLCIPILVVAAITCQWKVNIGLRHFLPVYPFLYLFAGRLGMPRTSRRTAAASPAPGASAGRGATAAGVLVLAAIGWNAVEAARIAPHHLAYFNALVGGPRNGHLYLLDSNLDWGQAARALRRYMLEEKIPILYCAFSGNTDPWYYGVPYHYAPGSGNLDASKRRPARVPEGLTRELLAVSPMVLHSVHFSEQTIYDWLKARRPIAMPGYAWLVYDITRDVDAHAQLAVLYLNFRLPELAEFEAARVLRREPGNLLARAVLARLAEETARDAAAREEPPGR